MIKQYVKEKVTKMINEEIYKGKKHHYTLVTLNKNKIIVRGKN